MRTLLTLLLLFLISVNNLAQEKIKPFVVNTLIGDTLGQEERNYYMLFPQIEEFQWAVFYLNSDSSLDAGVTYKRNGVLKDTLIQNYKSLKSLNYHLIARNALENGSLAELENESTAKSVVNKTSSNGKGSEVEIYTSKRLKTSGKLLSVRDNSLLILPPGCDDELKNLDCISQVKVSDIDKMIVKGNSNVGWGIGLGLLASVITGGIIFKSNYPDHPFAPGREAFEKSIGAIIISSICCIGLGAGIGILTSTPDEELEPFSEYDVSGLSIYSKYPNEEPTILKKIR